MTPESLAQTLDNFLAEARDAVVIEDGMVTFDLAQAKYSISGETHKCLIHLWSAERNLVRRVVDLETRTDLLRLQVLRMGQTRPTRLEICRQKDRRTPTAKRTARVAYQKALHRLLERRFSGYHVTQLSTAVDLERSFGPIYTRGLLRKGQSAFAVLGVNGLETQSSIDAALTFSILWLDACRLSQAGKTVVEGVKLFLPWGCSALTRERMAHLDAAAAKWHLFEFEETEDELKEIDLADRGNMKTRLVHSFNSLQVRERFRAEIARIQQLMPEAEVVPLSAAELAFRCHGLEFARARLAQEAVSLRHETEIVFGVGAGERVLSDANAGLFAQVVRSVGEVRHCDGPRDHLLWRLHPERWLESLVINNVAALDERLDRSSYYSQVPAFAASDRAMIDVLAVTRGARLAVIELKASEDIHLPLQGLDYWSRVAWHHARGEFQRFGYFAAKGLSTESPLLLLVAPALHVHPATDTLLRHLSPQTDWTVIGIDERWRQEVKVIFRKRPTSWKGRGGGLPASA